MKVIKEASLLIALLCCPEVYCDGAIRIQVHDVNLTAELPVILQAAKRNNCRGNDLLILLAIRMSEKGSPGREFGILHPKALALIEEHPEKSLDIQAGWAAATIVKNRKRWTHHASDYDFINFLGNRYCPKEVDLEGNRNWKKNVSYWYKKFKGDVDSKKDV